MTTLLNSIPNTTTKVLQFPSSYSGGNSTGSLPFEDSDYQQKSERDLIRSEIYNDIITKFPSFLSAIINSINLQVNFLENIFFEPDFVPEGGVTRFKKLSKQISDMSYTIKFDDGLDD